MQKFLVHPEYPHGWDVEWVGIDRRGRIGIFTSAGTGPIPVFQLDRWAEYQELALALIALPEVGEAELLARVPRPDDFLAFARRGYHAYDWDEARGAYRLQARPKELRSLGDPSLRAESLALLPSCASASLDFDARSLNLDPEFLGGPG